MTETHEFEIIIVGGGGAGLMAAMYASRSAKTAVISKLHPMRSHTGAARGGLARLWVTLRKITRSGIPMTPSKGAISWVTRTRLSSCARRQSSLFTTSNTWGSHSHAPLKDGLLSAHLEAIPIM